MRSLKSLIPGLIAVSVVAGALVNSDQVINAGYHHLGNDRTPEWPEASAAPEGSELVLPFESRGNSAEWVLKLTQRSIDNQWMLSLNGVALGALKKGDPTSDELYIVPPQTLVDGTNELSLHPSDPKDDIIVGNFQLIERSMREVRKLGKLEVTVTADDGAALPARLTVVSGSGAMADLYYAESPSSAVRPGIAYTSSGRATMELPSGEYTVYATRGMEWSMDCAEARVPEKGLAKLHLKLRREVDTTGYVAADTHIHTLTFSGHGDSSVEERLVTLAGEGVELAIATDHNHNTDYRPLQQSLELTRYFTTVVGNEVTTDNGHMNAFPLNPSDQVPPYEEKDWVKLVEGIRAKGAKVVILNHPRWPENGSDPFTRFRFNRCSGERPDGPKFVFDCIELVNSDAPDSGPQVVQPDWFAVLNHGERIPAVGASDSHAVGVIVGQGRTYVKSSTDDPTKIDVDEACRSFLEGRTSVSLGMFVEITVNGDQGMGDIVRATDKSVEVRVLLQHPSWVRAKRLEIFVNGILAKFEELSEANTSDTKLERRFTVRTPIHDSYLVAVATGDPVTEPFWKTAFNYTYAATNPVWLDVDGDGRHALPREIAARIVAKSGSDAGSLQRALACCDQAVGIQVLSLVREAYVTEAQRSFESICAEAARINEAYGEYAKSVAEVK